MIVQEQPDGYRTLNDATRVWPDGRVEQLGWPEVEIAYRSGTRIPDRRHHPPAPSAAASRSRSRSTSLGYVALHVGAGYGGDPDWGHGQWRGPGWVDERGVRPERPRDRAAASRSASSTTWAAARSTAPRAGACSSTARWAATTLGLQRLGVGRPVSRDGADYPADAVHPDRLRGGRQRRHHHPRPARAAQRLHGDDAARAVRRARRGRRRPRACGPSS